MELLVTDKASYADTDVHWRRAEARHIARRVHELIDEGAASAGEIVLLFAAGTDAEVVRGGAAPARDPDLPCDGARLLRPAAGRRSARLPPSPPQPLRRRGAGHRARLAARWRLERRPSPPAQSRLPSVRSSSHSKRASGGHLAPADQQLCRAFHQRYERLAARGPTLLERLLEAIVAEHDYDLAALAQWDGRRRYANMRKLARLARSYEGAAWPRRRGLRPFRPRAGGRWCSRARSRG